MMSATTAEREMAELLVGALNLEHIQAAEVDPAATLSGQETGSGN